MELITPILTTLPLLAAAAPEEAASEDAAAEDAASEDAGAADDAAAELALGVLPPQPDNVAASIAAASRSDKLRFFIIAPLLIFKN